MALKLSVVTTIYRTANCIEPFHAQAVEAAAAIGCELETVLVNDGSPDDGLQVATALAHRDPRVVVIDLSQNYGQHKALWTGLLHASGDLVAVLDGDLEEDPRWLIEFDRTRRAAHADVVYGVSHGTKGTWLYRVCRESFYRTLDFVTAQSFPRHITNARLMSRRYVEALRQFPEREVVPLGLWATTGFSQIGVPVHKMQRSPSTYNAYRLVALFVRAITSFTILPLALVFVMGTLLSTASVAYITYLLIRRFSYGVNVEGWTSVMAAQLFIGGMLLFFNGIIAVYVATIFLEVKQRPRTIVREVIHRPDAVAATGESRRDAADHIVPVA